MPRISVHRLLTKALALVAAAALTPAAAAEDAERTQLKAAQCVACHGMAGISPNPLFPHLAGQQAAYLQRQLEAFQTGDRYHPLMTPVAQSLTSREVEQLAEHFSRLGPLAAADLRSVRQAPQE